MADRDFVPDDAALVMRARAGDRDAFARLVLQHRRSVLALCRRLLRERWEAEDVAQEAALQAFLGLHRLADAESFGAWLHAIAANLARRAIRQHRPIPIDAPGEADRDRILWSGTEPNPEDAYVAREVHEEVMSALTGLSRVNREAVVRYYLDGYSYAELAELLGVRPSTVRGRLFEGRRGLRRSLEAHPSIPEPEQEEHVMEEKDLIAVRIGDFVGRCFDPPRRVVLLYEDTGPREMPVEMTEEEGEAVERALAQDTSPPPLIHDLLLRTLQAVGARVERVIIDRLVEETFAALVQVAGDGEGRQVEARAGDGIVLAALAGAALFATPAAWDEAAWDPSDIEERRRRASLGRRALEARVRSRDRPLHVSLPSPSSEIEADVRPRVLEALAQVVADIGGRSALLMERDGALLAWHGDVDADLARRYAAAAAQGDRDVMELSMMDLFPEDEVDALLFAATPESGLRIEVAVPVGFSNDPGVAGKRLSETLDGIDRLLGG